MKRLLLIILLTDPIVSYTQELLYLGRVINGVDFIDTNGYKYISIENDDVWFIARPEKSILFLPPNFPIAKKALITDTSVCYKSNVSSSFQFKLFMLSIGDTYIIDFEHKYDFEKNKDGGIIETSYDNGNTWQNILFDTIVQNHIVEYVNMYNISDTISSLNNQPGFTGIQAQLSAVMIEFEPTESIREDTMVLRFTFASDQTDAENEGWMLSNFTFAGRWGFGVNEGQNDFYNIHIYPNPGTDLLYIKSELKLVNQVQIFTLGGKKLLEKQGNDLKMLDVSSLPPGIYIVECRVEDKINLYYKFLK